MYEWKAQCFQLGLSREAAIIHAIKVLACDNHSSTYMNDVYFIKFVSCRFVMMNTNKSKLSYRVCINLRMSL